ncbi:alpha/beta fold hydrolase [Polynucleobacter sp. MWH-Loch1C5]|uniref:alpha/beta hydrolase family protein n=1 Tax=Polynucleobacter sp. MWH-Loch1C5 TaxID=2689108 RepID=UPI001C0E309E|nr:alpha/beta fold hydrolase [Polynucleobacter sp. MWH-Loch1C5]MBU3541659.1 alpha/beta fold hydrolase [Polynucleobacter sp. MWH-Loch1C5]
MLKYLITVYTLLTLSFSAWAAREEVIRVPYDWNWTLETTIFKPYGEGPFPLVILNHGKEFGDARLQKRYRGYPIAREFTKRGYMVAMPMRLGFSKSDGVYKQYGCDMVKDGYIQAESVAPAVDFFKKRADVDPNRVVMIGYSYGGVVSVAYAAAYPNTVRGVISFAGGFKKISGGCIWDIELSKAYAEFGSKNKTPQLWIYANNDSLFSPAMVERMYRSFRQPNIPTRAVILDDFEDDGHKLFEDPDGVSLWLPEVENFFKTLNLPFSITQ